MISGQNRRKGYFFSFSGSNSGKFKVNSHFFRLRTPNITSTIIRLTCSLDSKVLLLSQRDKLPILTVVLNTAEFLVV